MFRSNTARLIAAVAAISLVYGSFGSSPQAQGGLSISFGSFNNSAWPAGPDYATDVLGDPWDFSNAEDIGLDPGETVGWSSFSVSGGLAGGTTNSNDTQLSVLYRGRYGIINPGKTGRRYPIDPSRYQKLSFRMSDSGGGDAPQVYWFHYPWEDPGDPNSASGGAEFGVRVLNTTARGWQTFVADLSQSPSGGTPWTGATGVVRGLRVDPNGQHSGQTVQYDWMRLTVNDNAAGSAMQTISWSGGSGRIEVFESNGSTLVVTVATNAASGYRWNYGVLPPGTYVLKVTAGSSWGTRTFTIKAPPVIQVTEPNETGGEDFATTVLGNAWDMDGANDVLISGDDNYTPIPAIFSGGVMTATNTNGDANLTVFNEHNNSTPIDTSKYRFLTYRMQVDGVYDLGAGSMTRVFWSSQQFLNGNTATVSEDIIAWPGMNSYTIDLAALSTAPDGGLENVAAPEAWTSGPKRHLRLDPHEFVAARTFHIDSIKLAAMAEATNGGFTVRWTSFNPDGGNPSVALYYDSDTNPSNGKTQFASGVSLGAGSYYWPTGGVPAGEYYIYGEANDGVQTYGRYSTGKVRVGGSSGSASSPRMSLDGPTDGQRVRQPFLTGGWAVDLGASSGTGVDAIHVWAFPVVNGVVGAGRFVDQATLGGYRPDVGAVFGSQFSYSGYNFVMTGLAPGEYILGAYAHSAVTGAFDGSNPGQTRFARVFVDAAASNPQMAVDGPPNGGAVSQKFTVGGWAVDLGAANGTGVDAIHVWAFPVGGGPAIFVGEAALGGSRPDVGAVFGSQFTNSGFNVRANGVPRGTYDLGVYAHSSVTGTFNQNRIVRITVQ